MVVDGNGGSSPNYEPNSFGGPYQVGKPASICAFEVQQFAKKYPQTITEHDFIQTGNFYRNVLSDEEKTRLVENIADHLKGANLEIQKRQINLFLKADVEYGSRIAELVGIDVNTIKTQDSK